MTPLRTSRYLSLSTDQLDRAKRDYDTERLALMDRVIDVNDWLKPCRLLLQGWGKRIEREALPGSPRLDPETLDFGGAYHHTLVEAEDVRTGLPAIDDLYADVVELATEVVGTKCIVSPYPRSAITLKRYGPGDDQGFHLDTNPLSILVALTDCPRGGELIVHTFDGGRRVVRMLAGDVLMFDGRSMPHVVPRQPADADRVLLSFNTYYPDDTWRPAAIDRVMFES